MVVMTTIIVMSALEKEIQPVRKRFPGKLLQSGGLDIMHYHDGKNHIFSAFGGMGLTNCAAAAQTLILIARAHADSAPDALLFTGIAGNLNARLGFGDIVLGGTTVYEECDRAIIAEDAPYMESFPGSERLINLALGVVRSHSMTAVANNADTADAASAMYTEEGIRIPSDDLKNYSSNLSDHRFTVGTIASSNIFSTDPAVLSDFISQDGADAEEMEGAAVVHVCYKNEIESLIIRSNSNDCGEAYEELNNHKDAMITAAGLAAQVACELADKLLAEE